MTSMGMIIVSRRSKYAVLSVVDVWLDTADSPNDIAAAPGWRNCIVDPNCTIPPLISRSKSDVMRDGLVAVLKTAAWRNCVARDRRASKRFGCVAVENQRQQKHINLH